jgi:uncharacterized protein YecT (DUF1311 family)
MVVHPMTVALVAALLASAQTRPPGRNTTITCATPCSDARPNQMADCMIREIEAAQAELARYLAEARRIAAPTSTPPTELDAAVLPALDRAQEAWVRFRDLECEAEAATWTNGSGRSGAAAWCRLALTRERTRSLWETQIQGRVSELPAPAVLCRDVTGPE